MSDDEKSAFVFHGSWREYAPIAFTNLLLTIVTLGFYRFWATARTRRYLWSQTTFIDDRLEWTGTGKELFVGFLLVLMLFGIPFIILQFGAQALILQGHPVAAALLSAIAAFSIFYLAGVARFRALRYRLSRSYWHGIRGGSDNQGWGYGLSYMWKTFAGYIPFGLLIPWSMMSLWNQRWNAMSFGPFPFTAEGSSSKTMKRFLMFYLAPFVLFIVGLTIAGSLMQSLSGTDGAGGLAAAGVISAFLMIVGLYLFLGLVALAFYAKFFRVAVGGMTLSGLDFHFSASTKEWLKLFLGDIALVIVTLGIGAIFLSYRHWSFFIRHMEATGEIDLNHLTQSTTRTPGQGEGLLDAFDVGAI